MKREPLVSVCMPCYNHEEFVGQAIQSVLRQTYSNFELIIVDDVSADNSVQVIKSFDDSRIRLTVMQENTGFGATEYMFQQAQGEFICWLDSDDIWEDTILEKYMAFFEGHKEYGACLCRPSIIDGKNRVLMEHSFCSIFSNDNLKNMEKEKWFRKIYMEGNCLCSSTLCIRKEIFDKVGEFRFSYKQIHDYDYWLRFLQVAEIYIYPENLARYRVHWEGENANFSAPTPETTRRDEVERTYILLEVMENLSEEFFIKTFSDLLRIRPEEEGFCLECEKFLVMEKSALCPPMSSVFYYYRHYQEARFKYCSKNVYKITNNMIYKMSGSINEGMIGSLPGDGRKMQGREELTSKKIVFNPHKKPVIIWGAGKRTERILKDGLLNFSVEYIVDQDKNKKSFSGIQVVQKESLETWKDYYIIVIPRVYRDDIFLLLKKKGLQYGDDYIGFEELCEFQAKTLREKLLCDINREDSQVILAPGRPIGDMCSVMGYLKAYKERIQKSLIFYIAGERGREALGLCPYIERVEGIPADCLEYIEDVFVSEKNRIFDLRLLFENPDKLDALKSVKKFFRLPEDTVYDRFTLKSSPDREKIVRLFESLGLRKGKTVFIVPYANWFGPIGRELKSMAFWTQLCAALSKEGYEVVFNSEEAVVAGVPYVFLELAELPEFIEMCGNVVGIRTGLLNFIADFTNVTIQCFWPENDSVYFNTDSWKKFAEWSNLPETSRSESLMEAGLALTRETERTDKIFEFICRNDQQDMETIIRNLNTNGTAGGTV